MDETGLVSNQNKNREIAIERFPHISGRYGFVWTQYLWRGDREYLNTS